MGPNTNSADILITVSALHRAGRHLIPILRAVPAPLRGRYAELAQGLAETAQQRRLDRLGEGITGTIDALIGGCDRAMAARVGSVETMAQIKALAERLAELKELIETVGDQLEARRAYSPAPRR